MLVWIREIAELPRPFAGRIPARLKGPNSVDHFGWNGLEELAHRLARLRMLASYAPGEVVHRILNRKLRAPHGNKVVTHPGEDVDEVVERRASSTARLRCKRLPLRGALPAAVRLAPALASRQSAGA